MENQQGTIPQSFAARTNDSSLYTREPKISFAFMELFF